MRVPETEDVPTEGVDSSFRSNSFARCRMISSHLLLFAANLLLSTTFVESCRFWQRVGTSMESRAKTSRQIVLICGCSLFSGLGGSLEIQDIVSRSSRTSRDYQSRSEQLQRDPINILLPVGIPRRCHRMRNSQTSGRFQTRQTNP